MNILIIDDLLLPESAKANSAQKLLFFRGAKENIKRRKLLAREFQSLGANVLLARLELCSANSKLSFEYRDENGLCQLFIRIPAEKSGKFLRLGELFEFSSVLLENAP